MNRKEMAALRARLHAKQSKPEMNLSEGILREFREETGINPLPAMEHIIVSDIVLTTDTPVPMLETPEENTTMSNEDQQVGVADVTSALQAEHDAVCSDPECQEKPARSARPRRKRHYIALASNLETAAPGKAALFAELLYVDAKAPGVRDEIEGKYSQIIGPFRTKAPAEWFVKESQSGAIFQHVTCASDVVSLFNKSQQILAQVG